LIEAGWDCLNPVEVKAGMDLRELKPLYGDRLAFYGGIDVRLMSAEDDSVIEEEVRTKIECAKQGGGYIYHSDHSVPEDVSWDNYQRLMKLVHRYGVYNGAK
jgi:uroporphyrinogen decarboxylase